MYIDHKLAYIAWPSSNQHTTVTGIKLEFLLPQSFAKHDGSPSQYCHCAANCSSNFCCRRSTIHPSHSPTTTVLPLNSVIVLSTAVRISAADAVQYTPVIRRTRRFSLSVVSLCCQLQLKFLLQTQYNTPQSLAEHDDPPSRYCHCAANCSSNFCCRRSTIHPSHSPNTTILPLGIVTVLPTCDGLTRLLFNMSFGFFGPELMATLFQPNSRSEV
ncbi:hypothetical protein TNCV_2019981 [Trichonephila clavipes]|nr:hypothetical protein TNCV_2019981 [Trichonephila clavipes]